MSRVSRCLAVVVVLLSGCAPTTNFPKIDDRAAEAEAHRQRLEAVRSTLEQEVEVFSVSWPIKRHNTDLCRKTRYSIGLSIAHASRFPFEYRSVLSSFGIDDGLTVGSTANRSPAEAAGIRKGDKIVGLNGRDVGTGQRALTTAESIMNGSTNTPVAMELLRAGQRRNVRVTPVEICDYPVKIVKDSSVNASADGTAIYITTGMLGFVENREELALVIGHEMAHNTRNHIASKVGNQMLGTLVGALVGVAIFGSGPYGMPSVGAQEMTNLGARAGGLAFSQEFEAEADYVGVYHAARAGFQVGEAASMWRRMGTANPRSISLIGTSHPSTAKRYLAIEKAVEEIQRKIMNGEPLTPEER